MTDLKSLEEFYTNGLREPVSRLESARKGVLLKILLLAVVLVTANVVLLVVLTGKLKGLVLFTTIGSLIGFVFFAFYSAERWANDFKSTVVPQLLSRIEPSLVYSPEGKIESHVFNASGIVDFSQAYDYAGEDLVTGTLNGVPVSFCELHVSSSGDTKEGTKTYFRGMFLVAEIDVGIEDSVLLLPHGDESMTDQLEKHGSLGRMLSGFMQKMSKRKGEEVELDDAAFMEVFAVIAENEETATGLLTEDLRQKLIDLQQNSGEEVRASFQPNKIAIGLSSERDFFDPRLMKSILSYDVVREVAEDVVHAIRIVTAIQLLSARPAE